MTVAELIEKLEDFDQEEEVYVKGEGMTFEIGSVFTDEQTNSPTIGLIL